MILGGSFETTKSTFKMMDTIAPEMTTKMLWKMMTIVAQIFKKESKYGFFEILRKKQVKTK